MSISDIGPKPNAFDIETETRDNANYRSVAWTGKYLQVTLMSIEPGGNIGLEAHPDTDQFLRVDAGKGVCKMGPAEDDLNFEQEVSDGWAIVVPAGAWHDVVNTGDEPLPASIGAHPAFNWPLLPDLAKTDYRLTFASAAQAPIER